MVRLWVRIMKKQHILRSETIEMTDDVQDALTQICAIIDIPRPIFLQKHTREWTQFQQTSFSQDHFVEHIPFDKLEIEQINTEAPKRKSHDPRNG